MNRHPDENRGLGRLCRGSIPFFSKEGVAGSTRRGSFVLVRGHCCGLVSGGNAEIPAFAGMTKKGAGVTVQFLRGPIRRYDVLQPTNHIH